MSHSQVQEMALESSEMAEGSQSETEGRQPNPAGSLWWKHTRHHLHTLMLDG